MRLFIWGIILLALQGLTMWLMVGAVYFPLTCLAIAGLGALTRRRYRLSQEQAIAFCLLLALAFVARWWIFSYSRMEMTSAHGLAYACAQYFMALQVAAYWVKVGPSNTLTSMFPLFGIIALVCAGNIDGTIWQMILYQLLSLFFVLATALYFNGCILRPPARTMASNALRGALMAFVLIAVLVVGVGANLVVARYGAHIDKWVASLVETSEIRTVGFSQRGTLNTITEFRSHHSSAVAVRVLADQPPHYLRGIAFSMYTQGQWHPFLEGKRLAPDRSPPDEVGSISRDWNVYPVHDRKTDDAPRTQEIRYLISLDGLLLSSLDTGWLLSEATYLEIDDNAVLRSQGDAFPHPHINVLGAKGSIEPLNAEEGEINTAVPEYLDGRFQMLADALFEECNSDHEKITAVEQFLSTRYEYSLGGSFSYQVDPVAHFLFENVPGHCELFASAAAILLRLGDVPARYVSGFLVTEGSPYGQYWIARNRDAHAWVEAYVPDSGWTIVEATPPDGVPEAVSASRLSYLWDYAKFRFDEVIQTFRRSMVEGILGAITAFIDIVVQFFMTTIPGRFLSIAVLVVMIWWSIRCRLLLRTPPPPHSPWESFHHLLASMDVQVSYYDMERRPDETLHAFADRLDDAFGFGGWGHEAAEWYRRYAKIRYRSNPTPDAVDALRNAMPPRLAENGTSS